MCDDSRESCFVCDYPLNVNINQSRGVGFAFTENCSLAKSSITGNGENGEMGIIAQGNTLLPQNNNGFLHETVFIVHILFGIRELEFSTEFCSLFTSEQQVLIIPLCERCQESVEYAWQIYEDLISSLQKFRKIQGKLVQRVHEGISRREGGNDKEETGTESSGGKEINSVVQILDKWKQCIRSYDYGSAVDAFLVEDLDLIVKRVVDAVQLPSSTVLRCENGVWKKELEEIDGHCAHEDFMGTNDFFKLDEVQQLVNNLIAEEQGEGDGATKDDTTNVLENVDESRKEGIDTSENQLVEEDWISKECESSNQEEENSLQLGSDVEMRDCWSDNDYTSHENFTSVLPEIINRRETTSVFLNALKDGKDASFPCPEEGCVKICLSKGGLHAHLSRCHSPRIMCSKCHKRFYGEEALQKHLSTCRPEFACKICEKKFQTAVALRIHTKMAHNLKKTFDCTEENCGKYYSTREALKVHMSKHKGEPSLQCDKCDMRFWSRQQLRRHHDKIHEDGGTRTAFVCEICDMSFTCTEALTQHNYLHHRSYGNPSEVKRQRAFYPKYDKTEHVCDVCGENVVGVKCFHEHMTEVHKIFKRSCHVCFRGFKSKVRLEVHLFRVHQIGNGDHLKPLREADSTCSVVGCRKRFWGVNAEENLKQHVTSVHGADGKSSRFTCQYCGKGFSLPFKFREHVLTHENKKTKPFICDTCGKGFANRGNLRYHELNTHKAERKFQRKRETKPRLNSSKTSDEKSLEDTCESNVTANSTFN